MFLFYAEPLTTQHSHTLLPLVSKSSARDLCPFTGTVKDSVITMSATIFNALHGLAGFFTTPSSSIEIFNNYFTSSQRICGMTKVLTL